MRDPAACAVDYGSSTDGAARRRDGDPAGGVALRDGGHGRVGVQAEIGFFEEDAEEGVDEFVRPSEMSMLGIGLEERVEWGMEVHLPRSMHNGAICTLHLRNLLCFGRVFNHPAQLDHVVVVAVVFAHFF